MNLSASPSQLALSFCQKYNCSFDAGYCTVQMGRELKYIFAELGDKAKRKAIKKIIFHYGARINKVYRYTRLIERIIRGKNGYYCLYNLGELQEKIKAKYGCGSEHYCFYRKSVYGSLMYSKHLNPTHECKTCEVCGERFLNKINDLHIRYKTNYCSKQCKEIAKTHKRLFDKYNYSQRGYGINKNRSKRYASHHRANQLPLITFVSYLAQQKRFKIKSLRSNNK